MKICVSTYSYGSYLRDEKLGIYGCIDHAAGEGFDGIEFVEGGWQDARQGDADGAERIKEHCERAGITPVAFLVGADFINRGGSDGREEIARVRSLGRYRRRTRLHNAAPRRYRRAACGPEARTLL